eukprot:jgi/Chlat1/1168/Chrsp113S08649
MAASSAPMWPDTAFSTPCGPAVQGPGAPSSTATIAALPSTGAWADVVPADRAALAAGGSAGLADALHPPGPPKESPLVELADDADAGDGYDSSTCRTSGEAADEEHLSNHTLIPLHPARAMDGVMVLLDRLGGAMQTSVASLNKAVQYLSDGRWRMLDSRTVAAVEAAVHALGSPKFTTPLLNVTTTIRQIVLPTCFSYKSYTQEFEQRQDNMRSQCLEGLQVAAFALEWLQGLADASLELVQSHHRPQHLARVWRDVHGVRAAAVVANACTALMQAISSALPHRSDGAIKLLSLVSTNVSREGAGLALG